jgi:endonuclease YncB( thermonuclease family)
LRRLCSRRIWRGLAAVGLAFLAAGCGEGVALDRLAAGEHGRVAAVRSGDAVVLDSGLTVRLAGLEVPRDGEPGAAEAEAALARIALGREVQLYYGGARRDAFGRALAQVRLTGGGWVQGLMLRQGEAEVRTFVDNRAMARLMLGDEARARLAGRGLWRPGGGYVVRLPQELTATSSGFQLVEGQVRRVTPAGQATYLDFAGAKDGFAAQVAPGASLDLIEAGLAPERLAARLVRVRGVIGQDGLMRIDHPEQIELLGKP